MQGLEGVNNILVSANLRPRPACARPGRACAHSRHGARQSLYAGSAIQPPGLAPAAGAGCSAPAAGERACARSAPSSPFAAASSSAASPGCSRISLICSPKTQHKVTHPAQTSKQAARLEGGRTGRRAETGCRPGRGRACAGRWKSDSLRRARFLTSRRVLRSLYVTRPSPNRNQNVLRAAGSCGLFTLKVYSRTHSSATSSASLRAGCRWPHVERRGLAGDARWPGGQRGGGAGSDGGSLARTQSETGGTAAAGAAVGGGREKERAATGRPRPRRAAGPAAAGTPRTGQCYRPACAASMT